MKYLVDLVTVDLGNYNGNAIARFTYQSLTLRERSHGVATSLPQSASGALF